MKNNQKKVLLISVIVILILIGVFYFFNASRKTVNQIQNLSQPSQREGANAEKEVQIGVKPLSGDKNLSPTPPQREGANTNEIQATLNILDKSYYINIKEGGTLYDAMNNIQSAKENNFTFSGKEFPSLGFFVEEINGIKSGSGKYWLYYVNGKEAPVGVSKYIIKSGDIINWKQE